MPVLKFSDRINMPIYEFYCPGCRRKVSVLSKSVSASSQSRCPDCGSRELKRLVTTFSYRRSTKSVWDSSGEPGTSAKADFYKDPRNIGRWTEKKFCEMGLEMPDRVKKQIEAAREGELPGEVKETL
ncbi:MAG: zinc ribbon domain-containing protein [Dehalococcoidia bacterium]|nr:MAG: zinc ribbon domain-containing protein [Dehalococcoidia bacterium]